MDPAERAERIDVWLRAALSAPKEEDVPPGPAEGVDMSPEAITSRLMDSFEMSTLCLELARAGEERLTGR